MPRRRRRSRANQLAAVPESAVMMAPSGRREDASQKTRSGLRASLMNRARSSSSFHHSTFFSRNSCHDLSFLGLSSRNRERSVNAASQVRAEPGDGNVQGLWHYKRWGVMTSASDS
jgi:hypothetical protein